MEKFLYRSQRCDSQRPNFSNKPSSRPADRGFPLGSGESTSGLECKERARSEVRAVRDQKEHQQAEAAPLQKKDANTEHVGGTFLGSWCPRCQRVFVGTVCETCGYPK